MSYSWVISMVSLPHCMNLNCEIIKVGIPTRWLAF